jgi:hypothetical protein
LKVTLFSVNASWTHSCLALYYLRNALLGLDYDTEIIELTLKQSVNDAIETIIDSHPNVLAISVYIWNVDFYLKLIPELRKLMPDLIIVAGGPEISYNQKTQASLKPDYLIKGYAESAFRKLATEKFASVEKEIAESQTPLEQIPFPYLDSDKESLKGKMLYYEASRGCACNCIYCLSSRNESLQWLTVQRVCADIDKLLSYQPKVIKFVDRSFNHKRDWAQAIWKYVIDLETDIPFHFEIHPDWLDAEDIAILSKSPKGRIQFEIGVQSIHEQTLTNIARPSDWAKVKTNLLALKQNTSIPLHTDLIVGLPGENSSMIKDSLNQLLTTMPDELQLGFLKVLQGTPMAETAQALGYVFSEIAPYTVLQTPDLTFAEFRYWERIAQIISQFWNKGDFTTVWNKCINWREPFTCLSEILDLNLSHDNQLHSIDRIKRFELMAKWINQSWNGHEQEYLADAIRWDWCLKAGEAWYPNQMQADYALDFRKEHYQEILDWLKTDYWNNEDWNFKRFIVFSATSNEFSKEYLDGYTKAVFVSRKAVDNAVIIYKKQF